MIVIKENADINLIVYDEGELHAYGSGNRLPIDKA